LKPQIRTYYGGSRGEQLLHSRLERPCRIVERIRAAIHKAAGTAKGSGNGSVFHVVGETGASATLAANGTDASPASDA
jgi:hypothetical protein